MRIIERALQEAEAEAKAQTAAHSAAPAPPVLEPASVELTAEAGSSAAPGDLAVTSRDLNPIVQLDFSALRQAGRLPSEARAAQVEDEIRRIKWPLLQAIAGGDGVAQARNNVILVTSAMAGEGKTFTSLNLALSIVRDRERRVVLVDGDVARPGLTPTLGLEGRPGLVDALEDATRDVNTITYRTSVEGLFFVPAGKFHPHAPEFFASSRMPEIIEALSQRVGQGVIIFDSPPLLATNEAQVATRYAGQVLMVVLADNTEQNAVLDALALVDKSTPVSALLNRVEPSALSRYYGHYYYGYDRGDGPGYGHRKGERTGKGNA